MPSLQHEAIVALFRNRPQFVAELLQDLLGVKLPDASHAQVEPNEISQVVSPARSADLVVRFGERAQQVVVVVEVQQHPVENKRYLWPKYLADVRNEHQCPTYLLVVVPDEKLARWCQQPIEMGHPGWVLVPLVFCLNQVPAVVDVDQAKRTPELAVLSAMAHGSSEQGVLVARAVLEALTETEGQLDEERSLFYSDLVYACLNELVRKELDKMIEGYQPSEFAERFSRFLARRRKVLAERHAEGRIEGRAEGRIEGRIEGRAEGRIEGRIEGRAEGKVSALLTLLAARELEVTEAQRQRILACTDLNQLDRWIQRGVHVRSVGELLES